MCSIVSFEYSIDRRRLLRNELYYEKLMISRNINIIKVWLNDNNLRSGAHLARVYEYQQLNVIDGTIIPSDGEYIYFIFASATWFLLSPNT